MNKILAEIDRRNFFRYLGYGALYYPFLRTLFETQAFGANTNKRAVFFYFPSGMITDYFHPKTMGSNFDFPLTIAPLKDLKDDIIVIKGVNYATGHSHNEGCRYALTAGGPNSLDNVLGEASKANVKLSTLRLGIISQLNGGYDAAISWNAGQPAPIQDDPKKAFEAAFGTSAGFNLANNLDPNKADKSILDFCMGNIKSLQNRLGPIEKNKLDFHLASLRELERRVNQATMPGGPNPTTGMGGGKSCTKQVDFGSLAGQSDRYFYQKENFDKVGSVMIDIAVQALACGITNVVFLQFMHAIDDTFPMDFPGGPGQAIAQHTASHHNFQDADKLRFAGIQTYFMKQYASLLSKMKSVSEGDGSLLSNSVSLAFSELADPGGHAMENVGLIMAGQAAGKLKTGQAIEVTGTTQAQVLGSMAAAMDQSFGSGVIPGLFR